MNGEWRRTFKRSSPSSGLNCSDIFITSIRHPSRFCISWMKSSERHSLSVQMIYMHYVRSTCSSTLSLFLAKLAGNALKSANAFPLKWWIVSWWDEFSTIYLRLLLAVLICKGHLAWIPFFFFFVKREGCCFVWKEQQRNISHITAYHLQTRSTQWT